MEGRIASAAGEPNYVVLSIVDKLGALLDVDVVGADIKHYSNVAFVLRRRRRCSRLKKGKSKDVCYLLAFKGATFYGPINKDKELLIQEIVVLKN